MQLSVKSVFSAADGAVGGGTIIPFEVLMTNTSEGHVLLVIVKYQRTYQIRNKAVSTRTRTISLYRHIHCIGIFII